MQGGRGASKALHTTPPCTLAARARKTTGSRTGSMVDLTRAITAGESDICGRDRQNAVEPVVTPPQEHVQSTATDSDTMTATVLTSIFSGALLIGGPAYAAYDKLQGQELFKNVAGAIYVLIVCLFFYRLFKRRASSGTNESLRAKIEQSIQDEARLAKAEAQAEEEKVVTSTGALWGAVQAGVICFLLFQLCGLVDAYFGRQELPDQFTARNITVTLRTIIRGLAYLMTFLFGANCVGLSGLAVQLAFLPEAGEEAKQEERL